jgi:signal transduction histidine kinase
MKYKRFRGLFVAMSLALTGVVCLQVFWLLNAVELEKKKFSEQVTSAMLTACKKMESGEALSLLSEAFVPDGNLPPECMQDSVVICSPGKTVRIIHNSNSPLPSPPKVPKPPDSVPTPPHPPVIVENDSVVVTSDTGMIMVMNRQQRLKSAVKDVYLKYIMKSGKADERISQKQINDALKESFTNAGITEKFSFVVKDKSTGEFEFVSDSSQLKNFAKADFKTRLFPGDMQPENEELLVLLDGHHARIISTLWPQFLLTFFFTGFLIVIFFMTFREALKQKKLSEIKNDFINNMTHEFKTPIATISLAADTLNNENVVNDPASVRKFSHIIKRENKRMNDQVEKILEMALTEKKELQIEKEKIDLNGLISKVVNEMSLQLESKNGKIKTEFENETCEINGDKFHLERVFLNLLDNAIKYSKKNPEIIIKTKSTANSIAVEISDNGIGIDADEQKRIFERFYRVPTGDIHDVKGFGLGLSYVKTIVKKHDGEISVQSKTGNGSTFSITFKK